MPLFLPSKSLSKVSADSQSVAGPVPFTVRAATRKLYSVPRSRPETQMTKKDKLKQQIWKKKIPTISLKQISHPPTQYAATTLIKF